jgi:hypothetical protein
MLRRELTGWSRTSPPRAATVRLTMWTPGALTGTAHAIA